MFAAEHTIYSMNAGLKVTYLYHDGDIIEVRIVAENVSFRGSADVYVGTDVLLEAAAVLEGFPKDRQDTREVCKDGAGHTAFLAEIEEDYREQERAQCATVRVDFEPASLDRFLIELRQVEIEHRGTAVLATQAI
jgi:hypothetical protein